MEALSAAEIAVRDYFPDEAQEHLDRVVVGLACSGPASAELARRYWIAQGVLWSYAADPGATDAFAASRSVGGPWNPMFGEPTATPDPATEYGRWLLAVPAATERALQVDGIADPQVWQDGRALAAPFQLFDGLHLLQVGRGSGPIHAQVLRVDADVVLRLDAPQQVPAPVVQPAVAPAPAPQPVPVVRTAAIQAGETSNRARKHSSRGVLIAGLALGAVGAAGLGTAAVTKQRYEPTQPDRPLYVTNLVSGIGGYTLLSASGLVIGTSFVVNRW